MARNAKIWWFGDVWWSSHTAYKLWELITIFSKFDIALLWLQINVGQFERYQMLCPTLLNCLKLSEKHFTMTKNFPSPKVQKHKNANISGTVGHRAKKIIYSSFVDKIISCLKVFQFWGPTLVPQQLKTLKTDQNLQTFLAALYSA